MLVNNLHIKVTLRRLCLVVLIGFVAVCFLPYTVFYKRRPNISGKECFVIVTGSTPPIELRVIKDGGIRGREPFWAFAIEAPQKTVLDLCNQLNITNQVEYTEGEKRRFSLMSQRYLDGTIRLPVQGRVLRSGEDGGVYHQVLVSDDEMLHIWMSSSGDNQRPM